MKARAMLIVALMLSTPVAMAASGKRASAKTDVIDGKPTARQIAAARGDCSQRRRKVEKLEANPKTDPGVLDQERSDWERSCAHAEMLMQAAGIEKPSPPPTAPPPPPTLIIEESSVRSGKPIIIDEPSAPPTTDSKPAPSTLPDPTSDAAPATPPGPYEPVQPPPP